MAKASTGQAPFQIWGDSEQTRTFTNLKDIPRALRLASENITNSTPDNAGNSQNVTFNEAVEYIFDSLNWYPDEINYMTDKPVGVCHRPAETVRAEGLLGWEQQYTVKEGIKKTLDWYVTTRRDKEYVREYLKTLLHER